MDRLFQALETVGPLGVVACLVLGSIVALILVLARR